MSLPPSPYPFKGGWKGEALKGPEAAAAFEKHVATIKERMAAGQSKSQAMADQDKELNAVFGIALSPTELMIAIGGFLAVLAIKHDRVKDIAPIVQELIRGCSNMLSSLFQAASANPLLSVPVVIMTANLAKRVGLIDVWVQNVVIAGVLGLASAKAIAEIIDEVVQFDFETEAPSVPQAIQFDVADSTVQTKGD